MSFDCLWDVRARLRELEASTRSWTPTHECENCGTLVGPKWQGNATCCGVQVVPVKGKPQKVWLELDWQRRFRLNLEQRATELEAEQAAKFEELFSCWSCGCSAESRCADHGGPCREGQKQSSIGGRNEKNPAGASLVAMAAIRRSFGSVEGQADSIIQSLRWHGGDEFWSFVRWGMFVGVERDGYVHS